MAMDVTINKNRKKVKWSFHKEKRGKKDWFSSFSHGIIL